jgi:hypothetical protein
MAAGDMSRERPRNRRTALVLAAVALAFFAAIMLKYWLSE